MGEIFKDGEALLDDFVAFFALDVRHKTDATGVMLVGGVIQTLRAGRVIRLHGIKGIYRIVHHITHDMPQKIIHKNRY